MSQAVDEEQQHKVQETLDWFAAKMSVFSKEEQEAINACAIAFAERDQIVIPKVNIAVNAKCSQADLMAYASSAFFKIGKKRKSIAQFLSIVFEAYFPGGERNNKLLTTCNRYHFLYMVPIIYVFHMIYSHFIFKSTISIIEEFL